MIVIDTNVVSEALHPSGHLGVDAWIRRQPLEDLNLTTPSLAELLVGLAIMPDGKRQARRMEGLGMFVEKYFGNRILPFDRPAAEAYASLIAQARQVGETISIVDGQIAAIASVHGFTVATRDTRPFQACGLPVINPWELPAAPTP